VRSRLVKALHKVLVVPHALPQAYKEHCTIFEAIERRDPDGARNAMQTHLEAHLRRYTSANKSGSTAEAGTNGKHVNGLVKADVAKTTKPRSRKLAPSNIASGFAKAGQIVAK